MSQPKILIGVSVPQKLEDLMAEGVDEFYCGVLPTEEFPLHNHRPPAKEMNFDIEELKWASSFCRERDKSLMLAVNELSQPPGSYEKTVDAVIKLLKQTSINGLIVADFYLLSLLRSKIDSLGINTRLHLSSLTCCFNSKVLDFYRRNNVQRIVFPQAVYAEEVSDIITSGEIETEVFFHVANDCRNLNERCQLCTIGAKKDRDLNYYECRYKFRLLNDRDIEDPDLLYSRWSVSPGINSYGNLYDFVKFGVTSIKIGVRGDHSVKFDLRLVKHLRELIQLALECEDKESFLQRIDHEW